MAEMKDHSKRDHALLSASSAARWLACPPSAVANECYDDEDSEFAQEGTIAHQVAELYARGGELQPDAYITQEMIDCAIGYRDYIQERLMSNTATVLLEQKVDFSPWVPDGFGTADCIILQNDPIFGDSVMDIIDYKFGKGVAVSAKDNPQMMLYGLGALNEYGFAYDVDRVRLHIYQPRMNNISTDEIGAGELMAWAEMKVKTTAEQAAKGKGNYKAGDHCRFCKHAGKCRTLTKTCTDYVKIHGIDKEVGVPTLAPWEIAEVLEMESLINLWLKKIKDQALTTLMNGGTIPGFKVVSGRSSRAWADDLEVAEVLRKAGYTTEDITETKLLSIAAMEKALGKKKVAELVGGHILTHQGSPTIAQESDKRPKYDQTAETINDLNS